MSKVSKTISDIDHLCTEVISCLEDNKGENIVQLSVSKLTTIADYFVIVTGNSSRHVRALAINAVRDLRDKGIKSLYYQYNLNAAQQFSQELLTCSACEG